MGTIVPEVGPTERKSVSLSDALFTGVQRKLLALLFGNPDRSFYTKQILRSIHSGSGAVQLELKRLENSGLVSTEWIGNQKHYRANRASPIFSELTSLVRKTFGMREPLRQSLAPHAKDIRAAFVYGSVAKNTDTASSDIDLMVIGDIRYSDLYEGVQDAEEILGRPINPTILEFAEWKKKTAQPDSFASRVSHQPKIFIVGSEVDLQT